MKKYSIKANKLMFKVLFCESFIIANAVDVP